MKVDENEDCSTSAYVLVCACSKHGYEFQVLQACPPMADCLACATQVVRFTLQGDSERRLHHPRPLAIL